LVSTSKNPRGEGLIQIWWCGKRTSQPYSCTDKGHWVTHTAREYGYARKCDAVRGSMAIKKLLIGKTREVSGSTPLKLLRWRCNYE